MNASLFDRHAMRKEKISDTDVVTGPHHEHEFGLFDSVFHEVTDAIAIISSEQKDTSPIIVDINHHFELVTGYQFKDICGESLYKFLAKSLSGPSRYIIEKAIESRQTAVLSCPWINHDATIIDVDITIRPFNSDNNGSQFICILRENNALHNTQDNAAKEVKKNLLSAMHHNFKTPLNGILGYSEIIMSELMGPIGQKAYKNYAQDIYGAGKDLLHLIDNLLEIKELETAEFELQEEKFLLHDMISECLKKVSSQVEKRKLAITSIISPDCTYLFGDKSRLQQMIHSLLTNALKFTPPDGKIIVTTKRDKDGSCLISCQDNGYGMSSQQLAKVFCHNTQLSNIYSNPTIGIGFGLSYVKKMAAKHQGTVSIISAVGKGTMATVHLPAARLF